MTYYIRKQGKDIAIETESNVLSSGGQGKIYKICSPYEFRDYCVKIYKDKNHIEENRKKIEYMVHNQPQNIDMHNIRICWPQYSLYDNKGNFVGFVMRLALQDKDESGNVTHKSRDLKILSVYSIGKTIAEKHPQHYGWHNKFELTDSSGIVNRMKMLHNWALALEIIHETNKYVIVDVKPDNVLATPTGKISIVDTDSFQINDGAYVFKGPVATYEYFPKFAKRLEKQKKIQTADCDNFALAVAFYKILIGSHPYAGFRLKPPYNTDEYSDISSRIDEELYVFGKNKEYIELLPENNMHERFGTLPSELRNMFNKAFTKQVNLPKAEEWKIAFSNVIKTQGKIKSHADVKFTSVNNSEIKCLCVLVMDVSGSMMLSINALNAVLEKFVDDIRNGNNGFDEYSKDCIELSVIQFDKDVNVLMQPLLISNMTEIPRLNVRGLTTNTFGALDTAFDIVEKRKKEYKNQGLSYYRPWIVLLTDGNPNPLDVEKLNRYSVKITNDIASKKYMLTAIGLGKKIDKNILSMLSGGNCSIINKSGLSKFFEFLSASISSNDFQRYDENPLNNFEEYLSI